MILIKISEKEILELGFKQTQTDNYILKTNTYNKENGDFAFSRYIKLVSLGAEDLYGVASFVENGISDEVWTNHNIRADHLPINLKKYIYKVGE